MIRLYLMLGFAAFSPFLWCAFYHPWFALAWLILAFVALPFAGRQLRRIGEEDAQ